MHHCIASRKGRGIALSSARVYMRQQLVEDHAAKALTQLAANPTAGLALR